MRAETAKDIPKHRPLSEAWLIDSTLEHHTPHGALHYSPQYSDDEYVYRHINVPRRIIRKAKELLAGQKGRGKHGGQLSLSARKNEPLIPYEEVVTKLCIHMSADWMLYLIHERDCTFCFRRPRRDVK